MLNYFRDYQDRCRAVELLDDSVRSLGKIRFDRETEITKRIEEAKNTLKDEADETRFENHALWSNIVCRASQMEGRRWWAGTGKDDAPCKKRNPAARWIPVANSPERPVRQSAAPSVNSETERRLTKPSYLMILHPMERQSV